MPYGAAAMHVDVAQVVIRRHDAPYPQDSADDILSFRLYPGEGDFDASGVTEDLRRWLIMEQRVGFTLDERRR